MVGSKRKLSVGIACCVCVVTLAAWAAPAFDAGEESRRGQRGIPVAGDRITFSVDAGIARDAARPALAYRRILRRIAAARNNWAPMTKTPRLTAMTPAMPNGVAGAGKQVRMAEPAVMPTYIRTALGY